MKALILNQYNECKKVLETYFPFLFFPSHYAIIVVTALSLLIWMIFFNKMTNMLEASRQSTIYIQKYGKNPDNIKDTTDTFWPNRSK